MKDLLAVCRDLIEWDRERLKTIADLGTENADLRREIARLQREQVDASLAVTADLRERGREERGE